MRRLFLILMIALLPLRGWAGDVMAVSLAAPAVHASLFATEKVANNAEPARQETHFHTRNAEHSASTTATGHCDELAAGDMHHPDPTANGHHSPGKTCSACDICHSVALHSPGQLLTPEHTPVTAPRSSTPSDTSVARLPGHKPPIA